MAALLNHHSFIVAVIILLLIAGIAIGKMQRGRLIVRLAGWFVLLVLLVTTWLVFRPSPPTTVTSLAEAQRLIGNNRPTVLEFYSAY